MSIRLIALALFLAHPLSACLEEDRGAVATDPTEPTDPTDPTEPTDTAMGTLHCPTSGLGDDDVLMVGVGADGAWLLRAGGALERLATPIADAERGNAWVLRAGPRFAIAERQAFSDRQGPTRLTVFDADGAPSWSRAWPDGSRTPRYLGVDGSVVLETNRITALGVPRYVIATAAGDERPVPDGLSPMAGLDATGHLPGHKGEAVAFWSPEEGASQIAVVDGAAQLAAGRLMVLRDLAPGQVALDLVAPSGVTSLPLSALGADVTAADLELIQAGQRWALYRVGAPDGDAVDTWVRVDLDAARADVRSFAYPPGARPFASCFLQDAAVDVDGRLLVGVRTDAFAAVWRLDPDLPYPTWERVSAPMTEVVALRLEARGETVVIRAYGRSETYCPDVEWPTEGAPAEVVAGSHVQLIVGDHALSVFEDLSPWTWDGPLLSQDGLCAAISKGTGQETSMVTLDLGTGTLVGIDASGWPTWLY